MIFYRLSQSSTNRSNNTMGNENIFNYTLYCIQDKLK